MLNRFNLAEFPLDEGTIVLPVEMVCRAVPKLSDSVTEEIVHNQSLVSSRAQVLYHLLVLARPPLLQVLPILAVGVCALSEYVAHLTVHLTPLDAAGNCCKL